MNVTSMTVEDALQIYTGRRVRWEDGAKIAVFLLPESHKVSRAFAYEVLNLSPAQLYDGIRNATAQRKTNSITILDTDDELIKAVSRTQHSIGYASDFVLLNHKGEVKKVKLK